MGALLLEEELEELDELEEDTDDELEDGMYIVPPPHEQHATSEFL